MTDRHINHEAYRSRRRAASKKYAKEHPEKVIAARASWKARNPEYAKSKARADRQSKPLHIRNIRLKHRYGFVPPPAPTNCQACGIPFALTKTHHGACCDHDHKRGEFRGWICNNCNLALGRAGDSRDRLQLLIHYLDRYELTR